ncbi:MAG: ABC transporter ATP-binding protein [Ezakiella sp.]|nr:ABC transporter ATP-binding protein [Ezakiella sp.]MDD7471382.1 ABC transporter ATP-binding protein [Bacillota bacterium]MDY3922879.1 ABC transporter ATP-binding protein [Ezakiella sp.]
MFARVKDVVKTYGKGENLIIANDHITFEIDKGELVVIVGPSGAGKSTILNILGGMDRADSGEIVVDDVDISHATEKDLTMYRRYKIGFVFQFYNLINNLTAKENVELASQIVKEHIPAEEILAQVGLKDRMNNFPPELSGGEQQRVAIARALSKKPAILLCDEPTGALDYHTGKDVLKLLQKASREWGTTVVIITHNTAITPIADRVIEIWDSKVRNITLNKNPADIETIEW